MPAGSKVEKVERKLKSEAKKKGVRNPDAYVFGTLNKAGLMRGNKTTARGRQKAKR